MSTFADRVILFNNSLPEITGLPEHFAVMNPFKDNPEISRVTGAFYHRFYHDNKPRTLMLGINPGRFGAGTTGIPFTDTRHLNHQCGIRMDSVSTHEPSSVFIYDMIAAYGGVAKFFGRFFLNSVLPLGLVRVKPDGKKVNFNYYDDKSVLASLLPTVDLNLTRLLELGCDTSVCFCIGSGKNFSFLSRLNTESKYFKKVIPLEHPRFVMQYRLKLKSSYIKDYLAKLGNRIEVL
ncbi:MAG TPA: DUF4918 family protein [Bacteroidales bacterium]|nr:DUF4918 family protein [Bacteroidales bacterium]HSA43816.1 DUF4918 family protein [Bacteroidales bacterium]